MTDVILFFIFAKEMGVNNYNLRITNLIRVENETDVQKKRHELQRM